jgi:nitrogen-specific signal transduction histidine kinase
VTERKILEAQLLQAQKMEAVGTLAGGVAHDFNNILMALMGYANLIQLKMKQDDPMRVYVDQMVACTGKAANLTQSLLAFSRKQLMELKPCKINSLVMDVEKLLRTLLPEDIVLTLSLGSDTTIMADMTQIDQVLMNLAANARDAMLKGGELRIETARMKIGEDFKKFYGYGNPGSYAIVSVSDTGMGMNETTREKIFEPFYTTKDVGKGTGLGLSIVYGIIKQHNGFINVYSEPDAGTTFRIYIPEAKTRATEEQHTGDSAEGGTETILFAEDNPDIRRIAKETLVMSGYTLIEAVDGEDAVGKFMEHRNEIDLLILDVVMPNKNGKEAYDEIAAVQPDIKTLFISGHTGDVLLSKGVQGEFNYVPKPFSPRTLLAKIREVLDK